MYTNYYKNLPFLRSSGFPFLIVAIIISPLPAAGIRLRRPLIPYTEITNKFLAPKLIMILNQIYIYIYINSVLQIVNRVIKSYYNSRINK